MHDGAHSEIDCTCSTFLGADVARHSTVTMQSESGQLPTQTLHDAACCTNSKTTCTLQSQATACEIANAVRIDASHTGRGRSPQSFCNTRH